MLLICCICGASNAANTHPPETRHLDAPVELTQFEFLLGEHNCQDVLTTLDGKRLELRSHHQARYILNGYAIQDSSTNSRFSTTTIRTYDTEQQQWQVSYFRQPGLKTGVWTGSIQGKKIVLSQPFEFAGENVVSELTFSDISAAGYHWTSAYISPDRRFVRWTSSCTRVPQESTLQSE